ncbi:MAG TPA: asparaginase [Burkholderiales bacterium]|nr:asparaginase [Burkholderiales bacterium]
MSFVKMVEVWRGEVVESVHYGAAAVSNARGEIVAGWGDIDTVIYPRSALKPIQAIALVETGAFEKMGLSAQHLALACASHYGEPFHVELVAGWLARLGLDQDALACGPDLPMDAATAHAALRRGASKQRIYHNCSGKHCGFLSVCRHLGWPVDGYDRLDHPAQQLYLDALSEMAAVDARGLTFGIDGCTLPAAAMPLKDMAATMARFADARAASAGRRAAVMAIHDAMRAHPRYASGTDAPGVRIAHVTRGRVIVKTGAEGFITAYVPEQGLALALKIADGEPRARVPALIASLAATGMISGAERDELARLAEPPILDSIGREVGRLRARTGDLAI